MQFDTEITDRPGTIAKVLTIEDDILTGEEIVDKLRKANFNLEWVRTGAEGLGRAVSGDFDLITLDRMLPDLDGMKILTTLRAAGITTPVLMLSALSDVDERIRGLRAGGDDYLTKPFDLHELSARLEVLLRRSRAMSASTDNTKLSFGDVEIDLLSRTVKRGGILISLLPTEYRILEFMMRNAGQTLTRTMLFETVWGYHFDPGTNLIDVHMGRLRKKIDPPGLPPVITTVRGAGYRLG